MLKLTRQQLLDNFFNGLDIEFDDTLLNLQRYSISTSVDINQLNDIKQYHSINPEEIYTKALYKEMVSSIFKSIRKGFTEYGKIIDLSNKGYLALRELGNFMKSINEENYITCSGVASLLMDLPNFSTLSLNSNVSSKIYNIGKLDYKNVSVDPLQKYNESILYSYDKIQMNLIIDEPVKFVEPTSFNTRTVLSYRMDFRIINPKINYIITEETSDEIIEKVKPILIKINRDKVLNILLND